MHLKELNLGHLVAELDVEFDPVVLLRLEVALQHEQVLVLLVLVNHYDHSVVGLNLERELVGVRLCNTQIEQAHKHHQVVLEGRGLFEPIFVFDKCELIMRADVLVQHEVVFV